jgi:hypothetical protein
VGNVSTAFADKLALRTPVCLIAVPALVAGLRGVGRIDADEGYPGKPGLVLEEAAKLSESPLAVPTTLRSPKPLAGALPDAFEIFEGYPPVGLFSLAYDAFAEYMVSIALEAALLAGQLFEVALSRFSARLLQLGAYPLVALARLFYALGGVCLPVRIGGDVSHAEIYAEPILRRTRRRLLNLYGCEQVPLAGAVDEIGLTAAGGEQRTSALIANKRDALSALGSPDRNLASFAVPAQDAIIVGDSPERPKRTPSAPIELVRIGNLSEQAYHYLRGKPEALLNVVVRCLLKPVLVGVRALILGNRRCVIARLVDAAQRRKQSPALGSRREHLYQHCKFHIVTMMTNLHNHGGFPMNYRLCCSESSSPLKWEASSEQKR